jgi:hypothetical protein
MKLTKRLDRPVGIFLERREKQAYPVPARLNYNVIGLQQNAGPEATR